MPGCSKGFTRPRFADAPPAVGEAVASMLGSRVVGETPAAAGFTESVASSVVLQDGRRMFLKAGPLGGGLGEAVQAGADLAPYVEDLAPALVGFLVVDGWAVAAYEYIGGQALTEWDAPAIGAVQLLSHRLRERLDPSPVDGTQPYADAFAPLLGTWAALSQDGHPAAGTVAHLLARPLPYGLAPGLLAELEADWRDELLAGPALQHGDLRRDNVVRDPSGRLWLVDWTHRWTGPGWVDLVRLAPDIALSGHDPEAFLRSTAWGDAPAHGVNVLLAGLAGRAWRDGHLPPPPRLPQLRPMQLQQADKTLRWLATRIGTRSAR